MKRRRRIHHVPKQETSARSALVVVGIVIFLTGIILAVKMFAFRTYYQGYLIIGDPLVAVVREEGSTQFDVVNIPSSVWIDGLYGYGNYALASLWRLGRIDKRAGVLLRDSVSEALHIPLTAYIAENSDTLVSNAGGLTRIHDVFSLSHLPAVLLGTYQQDIGIADFLRFWWETRFVSDADIQTWSVDRVPYVTHRTLSDGTGITVLDDGMLDSLFGNTFELDGIRRERYSVAVYNATGLPGLGDSIAKTLGRVGVLVISVGNADNGVPHCILRISTGAERSLTVRLLDEMFSCTHQAATDGERADISLTLGDGYAARFRAH